MVIRSDAETSVHSEKNDTQKRGQVLTLSPPFHDIFDPKSRNKDYWGLMREKLLGFNMVLTGNNAISTMSGQYYPPELEKCKTSLVSIYKT